jgi:tetratricopeptide (TPR) repeat protein
VKDNPEQLLQFVLLLASCGHREAEGWLTKVNRAHPRPAPGLDALTHGLWADYYLNRGSVNLALEHNRLARQAVGAAAGQGSLFPMLAELPIQKAGSHLLAGDLLAAAAAFHRGTAPLPAPIIDEFRSPVAAAWVTFLQGDLVSARAALDRVADAASEHDAVPHGMGRILGQMVEAGICLERRELEPAAALLAGARPAARINGRPFIQSVIDTWIARLATAQGDRAAALASLAQARLARAQQDVTGRAEYALEEFRIAVALQPAEASSLIPRLPASTASWLLQARFHVVRRERAKAEKILTDAQPITIRERVEWGGPASPGGTRARPRPGTRLPAGGPGAGHASRLPGHDHRAGPRHHRTAPFPASRHRPQVLRRRAVGARRGGRRLVHGLGRTVARRNPERP